jgi:uncharacterized protein YcbK (DUF882 family)
MNYDFFPDHELACKCGCGGGSEQMDHDFMRRLILMRREADFPFPLSSAYRCPAHNNAVSGTGYDGPHTTGAAVDINIHGERAVRVLGLAIKHGMTGLGISQKGNHGSRFIHVDRIEGYTPRPWVWSY